VKSLVEWSIKKTVVPWALRKFAKNEFWNRTLPYNHLDGYLERWWLFRTPLLTVRLHHFLRGDENHALHDHPWWNITVVLSGGYSELTNDVFTEGPRDTGDVVCRSASSAHRLVDVRPHTWTLFLHGWWQRDWGFHFPEGWKSARKHFAEQKEDTQ
jgi:hypothetical protein